MGIGGLGVVVFALVFAACASPSWQGALADVEARPLVEQAELQLIAGKDAARAAELAERVLADAASSGLARERAFLVLVAASDALGDIERPLPHLPRALDDALTPAVAERIAAQAARAWARMDGEEVTSEPVRHALERMTARPGDAWEAARSRAGRELVTAERLRAGPMAARAAAARAGFILEWRLSAPWGDAWALDLSAPLGPETRPLAAEEMTGAGWGLRPVRTTHAVFSDGEVTFFDLPATGGVGFAETRLQGAGARVLRLESNRLVSVFVDGALVLARTEPEAPWQSEAVIAVPEGGARLTVKLATHDGRGFFRAQLTEGRTIRAAIGGDPAAPAAGDARAAVLALLDLEERLSRPRWDPEAARKRLAALEASLGTHAALDVLAARLALGDGDLPPAERRQLARARYEAVLARDPDHPAARRGLARIEREEERWDRALALLDGDADPRTRLELLDLYRERGWEAEALALVDAVRPLAARNPRLAQELIDTMLAFGRVAEARSMAEALERGFPGAGADRLFSLLADAGTRRPELPLSLFEAEPQRHGTLREAVASLRAAGELDEVERLLTVFLGDRPADGWAIGERVRVALQAGRLEEAARRIREALAVHPDFAPLEELGYQLEDRSEPFDEIEDGSAVLARWKAFAATDEGASWGAFPIVQVLERTRVDVRGDGSTYELSHRIRLVQTKQGADALGDVRAPDGARLLVVRTLKADGRMLEPERTDGKAELSFPELQPGDAVETAWVTRSRASPSEGGYLTGVSFASWGAPLFELDVEMSAAPGLALAITSFGRAPAARVSQSPDGTRHYAWKLERLPPVAREPLAISARSFFPFADVRVLRADEGEDSHGAAWRRIARAYASRLAYLGQSGARLEALAASLDRARPVVAAFEWVKREVSDQEQLNAFDTPAEAAVAAKKGNRALVLWALLSALGREPDLLLCAPERDGPPEDRARPTPNANRFFYPVVVVREGGRALYLDPARPYTPAGDLPAELGHASCLATRGGEARFVDLPVASSEPTFEASIELALDRDGNAKGILRGLARGAAASPLRQAWLAQDEERRRILFEQWLASLIVGARLVSFDVKDAATSDRPMRWTLEIELPGYARREGAALVVQRPLKPVLHADFAGVPELAQLVSTPTRSTPLRLLPLDERVTLALSAPPGMELVQAAEDIAARGLAQHVERARDRLLVTRRVELRPGRVDPSEYENFRRDVSAVIRAMEAAIRFEGRAADATSP